MIGTKKINRKYSAMVVAGVMGVTLLGAGAKVYASPVYKVSLDVNPGIEMDVNMFDRVVSVETNADAAAVLDGVNLQNMPVDEAVSAAVGSITKAGYFNETGNQIYIAATSESDQAAADELAGELGTAAEEQLTENGVEAEVNAQGVGYQMVEEARKLSETLGVEVTPGKYNLLSRMLEAQNTSSVAAAVQGESTGITKEMAAMPVKDIMAQIKTERTDTKAAANKAAVEKTDETATADDQTAADEKDATAETQSSVKAKNSEAKEKASMKSESKSVKAESQKGNNGKADKQED